MAASGLILIIPEKGDEERDAVASAWQRAGGAVLRLGRFWEPPALDPRRVRLYGGESFCLVVAHQLGLELLSPRDDLLLAVPPGWLRRRVTSLALGEVLVSPFPAFVKPAVPKLFRGQVYSSAEELQAECTGLPVETIVLVSEVVAFGAEARAFVLDGQVLDCALYEGVGDVHAAVAAARAVAAAVPVPRSVVLDVGFIPGAGWAAIEFNAAWGAGLNGCAAALVWPAIAGATVVPGAA
jgi:hypothetical protein